MSFKRHHDINKTTVELDFDNPKSSIIVIECLYVFFHVCDKVHTNNNHIFTHSVLDMGSSHQNIWIICEQRRINGKRQYACTMVQIIHHINNLFSTEIFNGFPVSRTRLPFNQRQINYKWSNSARIL